MRCEPNALRFAARERLGASREAQVAQAHIVQKLQARRDFLDHLAGNLGLGARHFQAFKIALGFDQGDTADLADRACLAARLQAIADTNIARFALEARAFAAGARLAIAIA